MICVHIITLCFLLNGSVFLVTGSQDEAGISKRQKHRLSQSDHFEIIRQSIPLLANKTLTVCVLVREPFVMYKEPENELISREEAEKDLNNYSGIAIEVIKRFKIIFKLKIKIIRSKDNQFGVFVPDKGWTGLIGSIVRNESNIGVTALSITEKRAKAVDFTRPYYVETATILLRIPEELQNYFAIFEPFSMAAWLVLLATIIILIFLITIMIKLEQKQDRQKNLKRLIKFLTKHNINYGLQLSNINKLKIIHLLGNKSSKQLGILHKLFAALDETKLEEFGSNWLERFYYATSCVLNILLIRDIKHPPSQTPIRILVCVWWLLTIVLVNIYFGILFGQLVVPRQPRSIETLEELVNHANLNHDQIEWCVTKGSALYELFRQSKTDTVYGQLGVRMRNVSSADEGVERVINSGWAFIREHSILTFKMAKEHNRLRSCKLQLAKEQFFSVGFGFALTKGSNYLKPFNSVLSHMIENGFVSRWQSEYWPTRNQFTECQLQPLREGEPLSMKHFISIYLVCSLMVGLSFAILIYQSVHEHLYETQVKPIYLQFKQRVLNAIDGQ